jgi:cytochrome d ubiquinol oxidase subunit II
MDLETLWFVLIAVLWGGYFLLEGFDFGVGLLLPFLPRDEKQRATMFESIGPVWDGNEVWLVIAGGATFAAFPDWYATMFSGFYIALLLGLVCLIVRVLSFEWRGKGDSPGWRAVWTWANALGSFGAPFVWGVALANLVNGVPLDSNGDFTGDFGDLFSGYTVLAGLAVVLLFAFHGATYLTIRTRGDLCERAARAARRLSLLAALAGAAFLAWTVAVAVDRNDRSVFPPILPAVLAIAAVVLAVVFVHLRRSGLAFAATAVGVVGTVATLFTSLYPRVIVSSPDFGNSLTVEGAASAHYTLKLISIVVAILLPVILLYQAWTYHVFRERLGIGQDEGEEEPRPGGAAAAAPAEPTV